MTPEERAEKIVRKYRGQFSLIDATEAIAAEIRAAVKDERKHIVALLARLEAAEDLIGIPIGSTTWKAREERWRKAAGK